MTNEQTHKQSDAYETQHHIPSVKVAHASRPHREPPPRNTLKSAKGEEMPTATHLGGLAVVDMSQRRTRQSALEKRLGVSVVTSSMPAEPSHYRLLASWTFEQGMRWLQGDLYPHLRIKDVDEGESSVPQAPPSAWRVRLVTSHDKGHLHKCCGAVCMLNIIRHLVRLSWTSTFEPFDGWLAAHVGVALFSRFFRVAPRAERVADGTITEEVRWHALLFSLRNVAVLCAFSSSVQSAVPSAHMPARLEPLLGALICLPFHVAVDAATARHGAPGWSSIRSHASLPLLPAENTMRRMLSIMQVITAECR